MTIRPDGVLAVGSVSGVCWTLFITEGNPWGESTKLVFGAAGLFVIFAVTISVFLAAIGRLDLLFRDVPPPDDYARYQRYSREEQEYLRRRAEDARMRNLMNPGSQQAPPTDWFGH